VLAWLRSGEADVAQSRDPSIVSELRQISGVRVLSTPSTGWEHLSIRRGVGGHPALRQKLVRQALAFGIDRVEIARRLFGELESRYRPSDSALFLNTSRDYRPAFSIYRYRPGLARRLLEQAGCRRDTDGIHVCGGERLTLRAWTIAGTVLRERGLELIARQLRSVGVELRVSFAPFPAFLEIVSNGNFDIASFAYFRDDPGGLGLFGCGAFQNHMGYCQRLVTRELDQADRILDPAERTRVLQGVDRALARDVPVIPLYQIPFVIAFDRKVRNVVAAPFNPLWGAENWWLARAKRCSP
jgi:peptide/nickel transport system substrate-binding protein